MQPKFVSWYGNSLAQEYFKREGKQTTNLASINLTKLSALPIPIPPAAEQLRIVTKLDEQFTRLDDAVASLKRVQANLKRYRASVLKAACEGRLAATEAELGRIDGRQFEPAQDLLAQSTFLQFASKQKRAGRLWGGGVVPELTELERGRLPPGW